MTALDVFTSAAAPLGDEVAKVKAPDPAGITPRSVGDQQVVVALLQRTACPSQRAHQGERQRVDTVNPHDDGSDGAQPFLAAGLMRPQTAVNCQRAQTTPKRRQPHRRRTRFEMPLMQISLTGIHSTEHVCSQAGWCGTHLLGSAALWRRLRHAQSRTQLPCRASCSRWASSWARRMHSQRWGQRTCRSRIVLGDVKVRWCMETYGVKLWPFSDQTAWQCCCCYC